MNWFTVLKIVFGYAATLGPVIASAPDAKTAVTSLLASLLGGIVLHKGVPTKGE